MNEEPRWKATVTYRTENGPNDVIHDLIELGDIDDLVERGPHWDTIISVRIVRVHHNTSRTLTVEEAAKL